MEASKTAGLAGVVHERNDDNPARSGYLAELYGFSNARYVQRLARRWPCHNLP